MKPRARAAHGRASWRQPGESDSLFVQFVRASLVFALILSGDSGQERVPARRPAASTAEVKQKPPERQEWLVTEGALRDMPEGTRLTSLAGKVDVSNRYLSTVLVTVELGEEQGGVCSGAVIGRRLVLTAGHCVCPERRVTSEPGVQSVIESSGVSSGCAKTARATTSFYEPRSAVGNDLSSFRKSYTGAVVPHPELRVLLDAQEEVVSSTADLALIVLDEPLETKFLPLPLADREVQPNESVVIVGTGYDELARVYDGERHASRNKIAQLPDSGGGRLRIEQPGGHHYRGDSGGPCLRDGLEGTALVGISARNLGQGEAMTSTYPYRDWLRAELQRVEALPLPEPSD